MRPYTTSTPPSSVSQPPAVARAESRAQARSTLARLRDAAKRSGASSMTDDEIDAEIRAARAARRAR